MKKVFYLYKSGTLQRQDNSLVLKDKRNNYDYIPIVQVDYIVCFGEVTMNKRVFSLLNSYDVTILFYNFYGNYIGRFSPKKFYNGKLLIQQVHSIENETIRLEIAYCITCASLKNCLSLVKYFNKKGVFLSEEVTKMDELVNELHCDSIEELLLKEAQVRRIYYSCFDKILDKTKFTFEKRSMHPPKNEINAMISYGNSLLYANYLSVLDRSRLHTQLSYIHSLEKEKESLQYDLADILKPVIVDRLVLSLCRRGIVKETYFEYKEDRCFLNKEGAKFFVEKYEEYLLNTITLNGKAYSYRNLISREVHLLSNYLANKSKDYKPYVMRW